MNYSMKNKNKVFDDHGDSPTMLADCRIEGCYYKRHGARFDYCTDHLAERQDRWKNERKKVLQGLGILTPGQSYSDVVKKCQELGSTIDGSFSFQKMLSSLRTNCTKPVK